MFSVHISHLRDTIQNTLNTKTGNTKLEGIEIMLDQEKILFRKSKALSRYEKFCKIIYLKNNYKLLKSSQFC